MPSCDFLCLSVGRVLLHLLGSSRCSCEMPSSISVAKALEGFTSLSFTPDTGVAQPVLYLPQAALVMLRTLKIPLQLPGGVQRERAGSWGGTNPTGDLSPLQGATSLSVGPNLSTWT